MTAYVTTNPATWKTERTFPELDDAAVSDVLGRVTDAYPGWRATPAADRAQILVRVAGAYEARSDELAALIATEMGNPVKEAAGEVALAASIYRWYAEHGPDLLTRETLDPQGAQESVVQTEPIGPLVGVMPWNFPYYQVARFVAPNLVVGNTIVLKHAPICAASAEVMDEIFHTAGVPDDVYVNVYATNEQIADMIADPRIQGISLTGSERAGASVAETAGRNLKKAVLELGGSDAFIVLDDADVARTAKVAARSASAGGSCRVKASSPESTPGTGQNTARGTGPARRAAAYQASLALGAPYSREPGPAASRSATSLCTITRPRSREGSRARRCSSTGTETL